jgi:hypothetical protein
MFVAGCGDDNNGSPTGPSNTGPLVFTAQLSAANEVPPVTNAETNGRGTVTVTMNVPRDSAGVPTGGGTANFSVQLSGFPPGTAAVAAHIHPGAAGVNGGVVVSTGLSAAAPFQMADGTGTRTFSNIDINQTNATNIMNNPGGFYFNVHTPSNPGGAVRGQLTRQQ